LIEASCDQTGAVTDAWPEPGVSFSQFIPHSPSIPALSLGVSVAVVAARDSRLHASQGGIATVSTMPSFPLSLWWFVRLG